jgi:3'-phosphoadenosine 5'-phosphosulfate sulfotransferase (PAPS reductase)/FAD synthetase
MNPYYITGPAQIGISGGRTSGHMVYKILEAHGGQLPADVHLCFQNTGKEREETLVFIDQMAKRWGVHVTWMEWCRVYGQDATAPWYRLVDFETASRNGEPFVKMLDYFAQYRKQEKGLPMWLPNFSNNACTAYLKIKVGEKHMRALGYEEWDCVIGIRKDEPGRYHRMMAANAKGGSRWESVCPSYTAGITKEDVAAFWQSQDFDLGIDSDLCWKKGEEKLFKAIQAEPERVIFWSGLEEKFNQVFRMDRPKYSHLAWYAENYKGQMDAFGYSEDIDCFCGD